MSLIQKGRDLDTCMGNAVSWLKRSNTANSSTIKELNEARRSVSKMTKSLESKSVFTVFGASQVGKSYLVKNLLSVDNRPLYIDLGNGDLVDFIRNINPPGGSKESTGIVTRFTIDKVKNPDFPVELRLLSVKDLILIFSRAGFKQIKDWSPLQHEEILSALNKLSDREWEQSNNKIPLTSFEVDEIFDSLESEFKDKKSFWNDLEKLDYIKYIQDNLDSICSSIEHCNSVFNIIWKNSNHLNSLFTELLDLYSDLNFESNVFVRKRAILNDVQNDKGDALMDISRVAEMATDTQKLEIFLPKKNVSTNILRGGLSAISKEIVLNVEERIADKRKFLKKTDFMDFPGARSDKSAHADSDLQATNQLSPADIYIRGKVSYLFDKYSNDFDISNLLFCIPCQQNEVKQLPELLNSWIHRNIGSSPADRERALLEMKTSPLMIVFTWWNIELDPATNDADGFDYKWKRRFNDFFETEMVGDHVWFSQWTETKPNFGDFYFLRDFNESHKNSEHGGGVFKGYDQINGLPESGWQDEMPRCSESYPTPTIFMDKLRSSFLSHPFIQNNIDNPEEVWNATSTVGNDGSELIAKTLLESSSVSPKAKRAAHLFSESKKKYIDILKNIVRHDDPAMRLRDIKDLIHEIRTELLPLIQRKSSLMHDLQQFLSADFSEVYPIVNQCTAVQQTNSDTDVRVFLQLYDFINLDMQLSEIEDELMSYLGYGDRGVLHEFILSHHNINLHMLCESDIKNDDSSWVVNVILQLAERKFSQTDKFENLVNSGFESQLLIRLLEQYKNGIINRKLSNKIDRQIATIDNILIGSDDIEWMSNLICKWWNEFVFECDIRFYNEDEIELLNSIEAGNYSVSKFNRQIVDDKTAFVKITKLFGAAPRADIQEITILPGILKLKEWLHNLERMMILNAGGDAFDQENQEELAKIYEALINTDIEVV